MFKKSCYIILIIIISGLSGLLADRYLFPYLAATKIFQKYSWLKKTAENVTVINKTEQIYVTEDNSIAKITSSTASSVVNVLSYTDTETPKAVTKLATHKNGTGLIVTSDGIIMTYLTAILPENARYKVAINDGTFYDAELLDIDSYSNLAFLKINASNLPVVSFGNSDEATAGKRMILIGNNAESYQNKYTSTFLNGFNPTFNLSGKTLASSEKLEGIFEANFPEESAYVGGPMIDYSGQVMGVTGSVDRDNKTWFFQIPSNKIKPVLDRAINRELDRDSVLGIYYISLTKSYALINKLTREKGAFIYSPSGQQGLAVIANSPAAKAGLKINDVLTAINGEEITAERTLPDVLYKYKKGDMIEVTLWRDGQEMKTNIQL